MRAALAALVLSLVVAGCGVVPGPESGPAPRYRVLRAQITPPQWGDRIGFHVNRPAYVALFEVTPGAGTTLLYPAPGEGRMDGFVYSGFNALHSLRRHNADTYLPSWGRNSGPRVLFLIASERPLNLSQFGSFGHGLRSAMGAQFASINAYNAIEEIAELTLPTTADDGSWTSDLYVYWPQQLNGPSDRTVLVRCNGYSMYVPMRSLAVAQDMLCGLRDANRAQPAQPGDSTGGEIRADSTGRAEPGRRAPLPKAEQRSAFRERITSSAQLEERAGRSWAGRADRRGLGGDDGGMQRDGRDRRWADELSRSRSGRRAGGTGASRAAGSGENVTARPSSGTGSRATPAARGGSSGGSGSAPTQGGSTESRPSRPTTGGGSGG